MKTAAYFLMPLIAATLVSCGGGSSASGPTSNPDSKPAVNPTALPTDTDIIAKIYDPYYSVPTNFFVDERASISQSYTAHHVMDESLSYELCADDFATAEAWEDADNASRSVNGYYVGAYENDRYYEFVRELSYDSDVGNIEDITSPGFARVFKCDSTSRSGVDRARRSGFAGYLNARPLTDESIRVFTEYLWQFAFFPARHKKVLASYPGQDGGNLSQTLLLGFASNQGTGRCDLIEVVDWRFTADLDTGQVTSRFEIVHSFNAELVQGTPLLCS